MGQQADSGAPSAFTGTYTGNDTTSNPITGVGLAPSYLKIWVQALVSGAQVESFETTATIVTVNAEGGAIFQDANEHEFVTNAIISLDSDGFTVDDNGSNSHPNQNGVIYHFIAMR